MTKPTNIKKLRNLQLLSTAYHEAGHAFMVLLSEYQELTEKGIDLNFNPIKRSLGGTSFRWNESTKLEYSNFKSNDKE